MQMQFSLPARFYRQTIQAPEYILNIEGYNFQSYSETISVRNEFPLKDGSGRHRQAEQERGLAIAKKVCVADDQIAQEQQQKQEREEQKQQPLDQQRTQRGKFSDEPQTNEEQPERQHQITADKEQDNRSQQRGLFLQ